MTLQGGDVCHAETHGAHHLKHSCHAHVMVVDMFNAEYLDVELVSSAFEVVLEKLSPNSSFFQQRESRSPVRDTVTINLGTWSLTVCCIWRSRGWKVAKGLRHSCRYLTYQRIPPAKRILRISRVTKVWRITVTGSGLVGALGSRRELKEEEVSLVGYHIRWAALAHPEKSSQLMRNKTICKKAFMFSR